MGDQVTDAAVAAIDDRLRDALQQQRRRRKLERDRETLASHLDRRRATVAELEARLAVEERDVEQLTSASVARLLAFVRGDTEERLAEEEAEVVAVASDLATERELVAAEEQRLHVVDSELAELAGVDGDVERLRSAKADALAGTDLGSRLGQLTEQQATVRADLDEATEAIAAGEHALAILERANELLRSAASWSTWDVLGGGGLVTMAKHGRLDDARQAGAAAAHALERFGDELADVRAHVARAPDLQLDGWDHAFDLFFDNIFTDLRIDGMIRRSSQETVDAHRRVADVVSDLQHLVDVLRAEDVALGDQRRGLLDPAVG